MSSVRILLVEDDAGHLHLLSRALLRSQPSLDLHVARTGHELLVTLGRQRFDCILLDFNLPDSRADDLLPTLTQDAHAPPVIVLSSSRDQDTVIQSMRSGSVDFIPKVEAMRGATLWQRVELALSRSRKAARERRQAIRRIRQLTELAETDPLTGLSNRLYLDHLMQDQRHMYDRRGCVCCIMADLDRFKAINDTWGHAFGDQVLRAVAEALRLYTDRSDTACRMGGEEFLVVKRAATAGEGLLWTEAVRERIERLHLEQDGQRVDVTVSMGFAAALDGRLDESLIQKADDALYLAKRKGRNRTCTWEMVLFDKLAHQSRSAGHKPPLVRFREVVSEFSRHLGPTQREHLTSHSAHVSRTALRLGRLMGLDSETVEQMRIAGMCHDIGKLVIPEDILAKRDPLSAPERSLLHRHAQYGAEMCMQLGLGEEVADCIRFHHTRFDGAGDECPVSGTDIPLGARILNVVDALVVITNNRSYSLARSVKAALCELRRQCGRQFDPAVVAAAEQLLTRNPAHEKAL